MHIDRRNLSKQWQVLSGRAEILARKPLLQELADEGGVGGALDFLEFHLETPYFGQDVPHASLKALKLIPNAALTQRRKVPHVLLRHGHDGVQAAVFAFEYVLLGVPTGCYIPADSDGYRTVIAPPPVRERIAIEAGELLLKRGGNLVLMSYLQDTALPGPDSVPLEDEAPRNAHRHGRRRLLAHQVREVRRKLPLAGTLEETLAELSRNTRHNFRRAMQQAQEELLASFHADAAISEDEMWELAKGSAYCPPEWVVRERYRAVKHLPGGSLSGLRSQAGQWLAVTGAHRELDMLSLDWQLNRAGFGSLSMATAMRGFLIASESELGTQWLRFESGTTHPLQRAFVPEQTHDLLFARRALPLALVKRLAAGMAQGGPLATVMASDALIWKDAGRAKGKAGTVAAPAETA